MAEPRVDKLMGLKNLDGTNLCCTGNGRGSAGRGNAGHGSATRVEV